MPRQLTANAIAKIAQQYGSEPINIIGVKWNGTQEIRYADREITGIKAGILSMDALDEIMQVSGSGSSISINITLDDTDGTIKEIFDTIDIIKKPVTVYQSFDDLAFEDSFILFSGQINTPISWSEGHRQITFNVLTQIESIEVGFAPEEGQFSNVSPQNVGKMWPLCFGHVMHVPASRATEKITGTLQSLIGIPDFTLPYKYWHLRERMNIIENTYRYYVNMIDALRTIAREPSPIINEYITAIVEEDLDKQLLEDLGVFIVDNQKLLEKLYDVFLERFPDTLERAQVQLVVQNAYNQLVATLQHPPKFYEIVSKTFILKLKAPEAFINVTNLQAGIYNCSEAGLENNTLNYAPNEIVTFEADEEERPAKILVIRTVTKENPFEPVGAIRLYQVLDKGKYRTKRKLHQASTTGNGVGAIINPTWQETKGVPKIVKEARQDFVTAVQNRVRLIFDNIMTLAGLGDDVEPALRLNVTYRDLELPDRTNNVRHQPITKIYKASVPFLTYRDVGSKILDTEVELFLAYKQANECNDVMVKIRAIKQCLEIESYNANYAYDNIHNLTKKIEKLAALYARAGHNLGKIVVAMRDQSEMPRDTCVVIGGENFPQNESIHLNINGLVFEGEMNGRIFTANNIVPRYNNIKTAARQSDEIDAFWLPTSGINLKGHYCMTVVRIQQGDPEWILREFGYDVDEYQIRIFKVVEQVGTKCIIDLQETDPVIRVRPQIKPNVIINGIPQTKNDKPPLLDDLPNEFWAALAYAKEHTDLERTRILENAFNKFTVEELQNIQNVLEALKKQAEEAIDVDQMEAINDSIFKFVKQYNTIVKNARFTRETVDKVNEIISNNEFELLLSLCNLNILKANQRYYDQYEVPTNRLYVVTGPEIVHIAATSEVILPSWLQYQSHLQDLIESDNVISLPLGGKILAEFLPESTLWFAQPGSPVTLLDDESEKYVANTLASTIRAVYAERAINGIKQLVPVPTNYYIKNNSDTSYPPLTCATVTLYKKLSEYPGENWDDQIYVSLSSSVGPNTVDIIEWILTNYTNITRDATTFNDVKTKLNNFPSSFALFQKRDALDLITDIASQARCAVWIKAGVMYIRYLAEEPAAVAEIVEDEVIEQSLTIECSSTDNLATKVVAQWKPNYYQTKDNQMIVRYNVRQYGEKQINKDYFIYNIEALVYKAATFWLIRNANTWKKLKLSTPLTRLDVETFDGVTIDFDYVSTGAVTAIVEKATYNSDNNTIDFELWLPVRLGEMTAYAFAWPADVSAETVYPSATEINNSYAGSWNGRVPLSANYNFDPNQNIAEQLQLRPKDYGEVFPADAAFTAPINPIANLVESDFQNIPMMLAFQEELKEINKDRRQKINEALHRPAEFMNAEGLPSGVGGGGNGGASDQQEAKGYNTPMSFMARITEIVDGTMGIYRVQNNIGQYFEVEEYGFPESVPGLDDIVLAVYDDKASKYYVNTGGEAGDGAIGRTGSDAVDVPRCSGQVYSLTRSDTFTDEYGLLWRTSWLETLAYDNDGCLVTTISGEETSQIGCGVCPDNLITANVTCCGENSFTHPSVIVARPSNVTGNLATWEGFDYDIYISSVEPLGPTEPTEWYVDPGIDARFVRIDTLSITCVTVDDVPKIRVLVTVGWSGGVTGTVTFTNIAAGWLPVNAGDHSEGIYKYFDCNATWSLLPPLDIATVTLTSFSDPDHEGSFNVQFRLPS